VDGAGDDEITAREIDADVAGCAAAHQRLLAHLDDLLESDDPDAVMRRASLLPDWTVGHVLTHLARNAESLASMIAAADHGEIVDQYPGGRDQRDGDIQSGADRSAVELVTDVRRTAWHLESTWNRASATAWQGVGRTMVGDVPIAHLPHRRWREVEIHHCDLGIGHTPADWSPEFVRRELRRQVATWKSRRPMGLTDLPDAALALPPHDRLAWLVGRLSIPGVADPGLMS
jgi:maleylpyruvate isomerase